MTSRTLAEAAEPGRHDFDFLHGHWRVRNERLRRRLQGCRDWERFEATQYCQPLLDGLGNTDELRGAEGSLGISLRLFDRTAGLWVIRWVNPADGVLQPPVRGAFADGLGVFEGDDWHAGQPVRVRFIWDVRTPRAPRWEQAFSVDGGRSWETNWVMGFEPLDAPPPPLLPLPGANRDFDFFYGDWRVQNRRLLSPLLGREDWSVFAGTQRCAPLLGGLANYDELRDAHGVAQGLSLHLYQRATGRWHAHWVAARDGILQPAMVGSFEGDEGVFDGADDVDGRPVRVRYTWSGRASRAPRWSQAFSADGGAHWETNWTMDYLPLQELR